jgi:hypothetical protein
VQIATNAAARAEALRRTAEAVRAELRGELLMQVNRAAVTMKREAPKFRSLITNSVRVTRVSDDEYLVRPNTVYAKWVVKGRKPGKGLPRFNDPRAAGIVAWLESKLQAASRVANPAWRRGKTGSARFQAEELDLRERYMALSRAIRARGIKPNDFPKRTRLQMEPGFRAAMLAAVRRGLAQGRAGAGSGAGSSGGAA